MLVNFNDLENLKALIFPIIIKPVESVGGGTGISIFNDHQSLLKFTKTNFFINYIAQEYIDGYDIDCSVLCKLGKVLAYTIQKTTLNAKDSYGQGFGIEFLNQESVITIVEKLISTLNWSGVAHVDLRYDEHLKDFKIIEMNLRFWGSVDASFVARINFPYAYALSSLGRNLNISKYRSISFLSLRGVIYKYKKNILFIFRLNFILKYTAIKFVLQDPIPNIFNFFSKKNRLKTS